MGLLDSLFGRKDDEQQANYQNQGQPYNGQQPMNGQQPYNGQQQGGQPYGGQNAARPQNADEQAVARYRYMLQTAPPEEIERAHAEAFERLTPEQRKLALQQMSSAVPENERAQLNDDPQSLARAATRAEVRQPGTIERMFGGGAANQGMNPGMAGGMGSGMMGGGMGGMMGGGGMGMGGMIAGGLLSSLAGSFIGTSIANSFFSNHSNEQAFQSSPEAQAVDGGVNDYNSGDFQPAGLDASADPYGDPADAGGVQQAGYDPSAGNDASADPYGDPGATDAGGFDNAGFDSGFDGGGFDGGFDGGDFGGDI